MKTVFIDTNVFLSFYHLTNEDIEELRKLIALIDTKQISLVLTEQVKSEFERNRASKIADAMKRLQEAKFGLAFPVFAKDYAEYTELRDLSKQADKKHAELVAKILNDAKAGKLKADELVSDLLKKSKIISVSQDLYLKALARVRLGNPPGKEGSLGDAINWGCLLTEVASGTDIHFVSEDRDFRSILFSENFNEFLEAEWKAKKNSEIFFYAKISNFFKDNFPNIKIASEVEKDLLIEELANSSSFSHTHTIIARLAKQNDFSDLQIEQLVKIAETNNQVGWIVSDADVHEFLATLLKQHQNKLEPTLAGQLVELVKKGEPATIEDDGIPW